MKKCVIKVLRISSCSQYDGRSISILQKHSREGGNNSGHKFFKVWNNARPKSSARVLQFRLEIFPG